MRQEIISCDMALEMLNLLNVGRRLGAGTNNKLIKENQLKFEKNISVLKSNNDPNTNNLNSRYNNFLKITGNERVNNE